MKDQMRCESNASGDANPGVVPETSISDVTDLQRGDDLQGFFGE